MHAQETLRFESSQDQVGERIDRARQVSSQNQCHHGKRRDVPSPIRPISQEARFLTKGYIIRYRRPLQGT